MHSQWIPWITGNVATTTLLKIMSKSATSPAKPRSAAQADKEQVPVQTTISSEAHANAVAVAEREFRKPAAQFRKIIEDWHAANPET